VGAIRRAVYQLHISLRGIEPLIWRRIQLWGDAKLPRVHFIFQLVFNWENYHLHEFRVGSRVYAEPDPDDALLGRQVLDEHLVQINHLLPHVGDELTYVYDFGDNWHHRVLLEAILLPEADTFYPRCLAGARNGPPEDAGGPSGYTRYVNILSDPADDRYEELLAWRGEFDAEAFSVADTNASFRRHFYRRPKKS
jgi:hypothetical protein